jgi:hypothetical protein
LKKYFMKKIQMMVFFHQYLKYLSIVNQFTLIAKKGRSWSEATWCVYWSRSCSLKAKENVKQDTISSLVFLIFYLNKNFRIFKCHFKKNYYNKLRKMPYCFQFYVSSARKMSYLKKMEYYMYMSEGKYNVAVRNKKHINCI